MVLEIQLQSVVGGGVLRLWGVSSGRGLQNDFVSAVSSDASVL